MKILVFSDSHGNTAPMLATTERERPDMILHLGDHDRDADGFGDRFPQIPVRAVRGNCDLASRSPVTDTVFAGEKKIVMTHGHRYNVKLGYHALINMGYVAGADILLFGHTHRAYYEMVRGIHVLNPGSCGVGTDKSCARIEIARGQVLCTLLPL